MNETIKKSVIPLYIQTKQWIINQIENGHYEYGGQIPGEYNLSKQLNVSRGTIREAIRELIEEGHLYTILCRGTFLKKSEKSSWAVNTFLSVADSFEIANIDYTTKVIKICCEITEISVAAKLNIEPKTEVIRLERLRYIKDEPVHLSTSFLPLSIAERLLKEDLNNKSLYKEMENVLGIKVMRVDRRVMARLADPWEAEYLQLPEVSAILVLDSVAYNEFDKPVECSTARFPTERSKFIIQSRKSP